MTVTDEQLQIILFVRYATGTLSVIGALFILINIIYFKKLHKVVTRYIFWLTVCSLINGVNNFLSFFVSNAVICYIQGIIFQIFQQGTFLYTCVIATNVFLAVVAKSRKIPQYELYFQTFVIVYMIGFAIPPILTNDYGFASAWCWIDNSGYGKMWRFTVFYIPLIFYLLYVIGMYFVIIIQTIIQKNSMINKSKTKKQRVKDLKILRRLIAYPIIFVLVWTPPLINRIYNWSTDDDHFILLLLQTITAPSQGFLNAIAYGFDDELRSKYRLLFSTYCSCCCYNDCCCKKREYKEESENTATDSAFSKSKKESYLKNFSRIFIDCFKHASHCKFCNDKLTNY